MLWRTLTEKAPRVRTAKARRIGGDLPCILSPVRVTISLTADNLLARFKALKLDLLTKVMAQEPAR